MTLTLFTRFDCKLQGLSWNVVPGSGVLTDVQSDQGPGPLSV